MTEQTGVVSRPLVGQQLTLALILPERISNREWVEVLHWLWSKHIGHQWQWGDWWAAKARVRGIDEESLTDLLRTIGYARATLEEYAHICETFAPERRRPRPFTISHHAAVMNLPQERQEFWLNKAAERDGRGRIATAQELKSFCRDEIREIEAAARAQQRHLEQIAREAEAESRRQEEAERAIQKDATIAEQPPVMSLPSTDALPVETSGDTVPHAQRDAVPQNDSGGERGEPPKFPHVIVEPKGSGPVTDWGLREFSRWIRICRADKGWSQDELASHAGVTGEYISDLEGGVPKIGRTRLPRPSIERVDSIARALAPVGLLVDYVNKARRLCGYAALSSIPDPQPGTQEDRLMKWWRMLPEIDREELISHAERLWRERNP